MPALQAMKPTQEKFLTLEQVRQVGDENAQNQFIGDILFQKVDKINAESAPKIVGMMLSLGHQNCLDNINNPAELQKTVSQAVEMLKTNAVQVWAENKDDLNFEAQRAMGQTSLIFHVQISPTKDKELTIREW